MGYTALAGVYHQRIHSGMMNASRKSVEGTILMNSSHESAIFDPRKRSSGVRCSISMPQVSTTTRKPISHANSLLLCRTRCTGQRTVTPPLKSWHRGQTHQNPIWVSLHGSAANRPGPMSKSPRITSATRNWTSSIALSPCTSKMPELQALNRKPMHMRDWISKLDDFLRLS